MEENDWTIRAEMFSDVCPTDVMQKITRVSWQKISSMLYLNLLANYTTAKGRSPISLSVFIGRFPHLLLATVQTSPVNPEQNRLVLPPFRRRWN